MKFRKMRKSNREIKPEDTLDVLNTGEYGVMSVIGDNGFPYGVPVNFIYKKDCIYFHCAGEGHKLDAIAANSKVSFCVVSKSEIVQNKFTSKFKSAVVFGNAQIVTGEEKISALMGLVEKYSPDFIPEGEKYISKDAFGTTVVKISIEHKTGKSNY